MGSRRPNPRLVKIHRSYTVPEIERLLGKHENTIRSWLKHGLPAINRQRPVLVHGQALVDFLRTRRLKARRRCRAGEFYCVRCRAPRMPAGDMADYIPLSSVSGNLRGICPVCETLIHRRVSLAKIGQATGNLEVMFPHPRPHIGGSGSPSVNCGFDSGASGHD